MSDQDDDDIAVLLWLGTLDRAYVATDILDDRTGPLYGWVETDGGEEATVRVQRSLSRLEDARLIENVGDAGFSGEERVDIGYRLTDHGRETFSRLLAP